MKPHLFMLGILLSGCIMPPPGAKNPNNATPDQGTTDADTSTPDIGSGDDLVVVDQDPIASNPYPLPAVGSGESAWWIMRWVENDQRPMAQLCTLPDPQFAIVAQDDGQIANAITTQFIRSELCMYWGGSGGADIRYHLAATDSPIGTLYGARGFSISPRGNIPLTLRKDEEESGITFSGFGDPVAGSFYAFESDWDHGFPIAAAALMPDGQYTIGTIVDGFVNLSTDPLSVSLFPSIADRQDGINGMASGDWIVRAVFRQTVVKERPMQYISLSFTDQTNTTCDEFWYEADVGPYLSVAYGVQDYDDCLATIAADDDVALLDPESHIDARMREFIPGTQNYRAGGYGVRTDYCLGATCSAE